jgi:hypothetical protein
MFTGINFPAEEEILVEPSSDSAVTITVPLKEGTEEITLLESTDGDGDFDVIGAEDEEIITSTGTHVDFSESLGHAYFVVTYQTTDAGESHLISVDFSEEGSTEYATLTDEGSGATCTQANTGTCSFGDVGDLVLSGIDKADGNVTVTRGDTSTHFDRLITETGALFYLPQNDDNTTIAYVALTSASTSWKLRMYEENKDDEIAGTGSQQLNFTYGFTSENHTTVSAVAGTSLSMLEVDDDNTIGYEESDLATKVEYDKSADEYSVKVTYFGSEVTGDAFIAGSSSTTNGGTGSVAVMDKDVTASMKTSKNLIVIGGSGANTLAADLLGLTFPTYGSVDAWQTATGVTDPGMALVKLYENKYATGKTAMLVAGFTESDTTRAAKALTTPIAGLTGTSKLFTQLDLEQFN